jgi:hypothetical protein
MHKSRSIWSIAICSSIITFLIFIAFALLLQVLHLKGSLLSYAQRGMLATAIYFAQRSYKASYQQMTYGQGVKVGFLTSFFMALWTSLLVAGVIAWYGKQFISRLLGEQGTALQMAPSLQETPVGLAPLYDSIWFVLAVFMLVLIMGTLISVILSWFSRTKNNQRP